MDARAMKRNITRLSVVVIFAVVIIFATCEMKIMSECQSQDAQMAMKVDCLTLPSQAYLQSSADELLAYVRITEGIAAAYSNEQDEVMFKLAKELPQQAYSLRGEDYRQLLLPINQAWLVFYTGNCKDKKLSSPSDFSRYLKAEVALSKIYGQLIVSSGLTAQDVLLNIDWAMLERLQQFRSEFAREGRQEYLKIVDECLDDWILQIESENGFTREYLRSQDRGLQRLVKRGELTSAKLREIVRGGVRYLQEYCGYTPRWLDAEFPCSEEQKGIQEQGLK